MTGVQTCALPISLTKSSVGLSNVDNTSDVNKPISTAVQTALNTKQNTLSINAPTGGFSFLTRTTVKGIIPSSPITITDTSGNLTIGLSSGSQAVLNNSAAAWSSGLSSDYYHYISSGTGALVISDSSGNVSANVIGSSGVASNAGNALF